MHHTKPSMPARVGRWLDRHSMMQQAATKRSCRRVGVMGHNAPSGADLPFLGQARYL